MDLAKLPAEIIWNILDCIEELPDKKNASLVCSSWNRMLFTAAKVQHNLKLSIFGQNHSPTVDEGQFDELFELMIASDRNYVNIEFCYVNFEHLSARHFLLFIVTVCCESIRCLKFYSCRGLIRSDLLALVRTAHNLEELHVVNLIEYDGIEVEQFARPSLRRISLYISDNCQFYQDICWLAPKLQELSIRTRDGFTRMRREMDTVEWFGKQLIKFNLISERVFTVEEYQRMQFLELVELKWKSGGTFCADFIGRLQKLQILELEGNVSDELIYAASKNSSLKSLTLRCDGLYGSYRFTHLTNLKNLKTLYLRGIWHYSWRNISLPSLTELHVETTGNDFPGFLKRTKLTSLEIHDTELSNKLLQRICRCVPTLRRLELAKCGRISDHGFKNLTQLKNLRELRLWEIGVSTKLFQRWLFVPLQKLLVYHNDRIDDDTLVEIGARLVHLKQAVFYDCYRIGMDATARLRARLPDCEVLVIYRGDRLPASLMRETQIYYRNWKYPKGVLKHELPFSWD